MSGHWKLMICFLFDCLENINKVSMREEGGKLGKIQKNVEGMLTEAQKIVRHNQILPSILQSGSNIEVFVPSSRSNNHLKLLLQDSSRKYTKRSIVKSERKYDSMDVSSYPRKKSAEHKAPLFYNRQTGRYELSDVLVHYEH